MVERVKENLVIRESRVQEMHDSQLDPGFI